MEQLVLNLQNQVKLFQTLENYSLEFGIFAEDTNKIVQVNILNTDQSITKIPMSLSDVMYFTEYGTLTIPARPILEKVLIWINDRLEPLIDKIYDGVFFYNWDESTINYELSVFVVEANDFIKTQMKVMVENDNYLTNIIGTKNDQKYIYNPKKLSNFIKVKLIKNNF